MKDRPSPAAGRERRSPTPAATRKRQAIRTLKAALAEDRLDLHYQPIVGATDSRLVGVEALLRWRDPEADHISLAELIWSAERSPVISRLEDWTLEQAGRAASSWPRDGKAVLRVNVNVSAREFPRADVVGRVTRRLSSAGLPASALGLEITETSSIVEFDAVADQIRQLEDLGIELWLDDFGTGHSSLEWLSHLPVHGLKIPATFVKRLSSQAHCRTIVGRVIELAHDLGLRVVAEGVENPEERDFLVAHGCDLLQGYLISPAMSASDVRATLTRPTVPSPELA